jgi:hypothetical protein
MRNLRARSHRSRLSKSRGRQRTKRQTVNARLGRAAGLIVVRLAQMGYRVFGDSTPGLPAHCMLLAVPRLARGRKVMAARICVSVAGIGEVANGEDV